MTRHSRNGHIGYGKPGGPEASILPIAIVKADLFSKFRGMRVIQKCPDLVSLCVLSGNSAIFVACI